jgi:lipopolysaccharide biosynthesis glycosyltransferase
MRVKHEVVGDTADLQKIRDEFLASDADALFIQADYVSLPDNAIQKLAMQLRGNINCISGWVLANENGAWNALKLVADHTITCVMAVQPGITMADYVTAECLLISRELLEKIPIDIKTTRELKWTTGYKMLTSVIMNFCNDVCESGQSIYMDGNVVCERTFPPPPEDIEDPPAIKKNDKVVVMFAIDDKYAMPLAVAIKSMIDHFPKDRELEIIVGDVDVSQENKDKLNAIWPIRFEKLDIGRVENIKINIVYHTSAIFARLLMPEILTDIDKVLYLDCDIIVQDDITRLWDMDISGHVLGAVQDDTIHERDGHVYFNSGVLLMNMKKWREENVSEKAVEFVTKNITNFTDQDALNHIMRGNFLRISKKWNKYSTTETESLKIIHFLGGEKPWWFNSKMPVAPKYFEVLDETPFKGWRPSMNNDEVVVIK